jgi:hypothetical protein
VEAQREKRRWEGKERRILQDIRMVRMEKSRIVTRRSAGENLESLQR